ncbi:hypothetical protein SRABI96_04443 [Peribacillus sp. Bi96]|nr:cupin domain-containing protein [Peribacillus sp. Bi96]CAH0296466.1 hypothetical protein SRABI96_04443 [Peribacillus sp. Bi96]
MPTSYMDYTALSTQYFADVNKNRLNTRNHENYINRLGRDVLNTLGEVSLLDIHLSQGRVVEPHYHQNAAELVYCISGSATVSLINPFNNQVINIPIQPGQVANIPQGWWHWEEASEDGTHLIAIFDAPYPEYILGSDILTKTPIEVLAHTYCLDPEKLKETLKPLHGQTIVIGPTDECVAGKTQQAGVDTESSSMNNHYMSNQYMTNHSISKQHMNSQPMRNQYMGNQYMSNQHMYNHPMNDQHMSYHPYSDHQYSYPAESPQVNYTNPYYGYRP